MAVTPPIGHPNPATAFGWEIDRATPSWPASWLTGPTTPTPGFYFVDNTDPSATDSGNPYGHPDVPRLTHPYMGDLPAGAFIYTNAGVYLYGTVSLTGSGTSSDPIWITGNPSAHPTFQFRIHVGETDADASYIVIEHFDFEPFDNSYYGSIDIRPNYNTRVAEFILLRHLNMRGPVVTNSSSGISIGASLHASGIVSNVVVWDCDIYEYGDYYIDSPGESEQAAVLKDYRSDFVWVWDCNFWLIGADPIAGSHNANDTDRLSTNFFIGRCDIECGGENCIDLKATRRVVISECDIHGLAHREQGWLVVLHSGANPVPCREVSVIFNRIYHGSAGVIGTSTNGTQDIIVAGNLIYDIDGAYGPQPDPAFSGWAVGILATQGTGNFIAHNTCWDCQRGLTATNLSASNTVQIRGNILSSISGYSIDIASGVESYFNSDYNLFDPAATFFWNNASRNLAYMQGTAGVELNSIGGDPDFTNAAGGNFALLLGSPAIDVGIEGGAYAAFLALFSESIQFDFDGVSRPQNGDWDTGALEYVGVVGTSINITTLNATTLTVG